jgi:hypothetical protein
MQFETTGPANLLLCFQVLAPWQKKDAEDTSTTVRAIRWQRTCLLSLLQLTQLVLQYPSLDATVSLTELVKTATKWLQDGIKALCGQLVEQQPAVQKSAWEAAATPAAALSEDGSSRGSNMINSPNAIYVQVGGCPCTFWDMQQNRTGVTARCCLLCGSGGHTHA